MMIINGFEYRFFTRSKLYNLFCYESWQKKTHNDFLPLLQALSDKAAERLGIARRTVRLVSLAENRWGAYDASEPEFVTINENYTEKIIVHEDRNMIIGVAVFLMEAIFHENYHAYQHDVVENRISRFRYLWISWKTRKLWKFFICGTGIENDCNYDYFQCFLPHERYAYNFAEKQVRKAFTKNRKDIGFKAWSRYIIKRGPKAKILDLKKDKSVKSKKAFFRSIDDNAFQIMERELHK